MSKKNKNSKDEYTCRREGEIIKIEIRDGTRKILYRTKFNAQDKNALIMLLGVLEKYSGFSVYALIQEKLKVGEWW